MKASDLIVQVHLREHARLNAWVQEYLDWRDASLYAAQAMVGMWTKATRDENTRHGPIEFMQTSLMSRIRRIREIRGSYLSVAAPFTISLPLDSELNELADAYSLVQCAAGCFNMEWTLRTDVQAWLYEAMEPNAEPVVGPGRARSVAAGSRLVEHARRVLDDGTATALDAYGWREACRRRELDRSRKWLIRATMAQRGHSHVPQEKVHDLRRHVEVVPEDPLAGSRTARAHQPGDHDGRPAEPADHRGSDGEVVLGGDSRAGGGGNSGR